MASRRQNCTLKRRIIVHLVPRVTANQHSRGAVSKERTPLEKCKQVRVPTTLDVIPVNEKMRFRVKTSFLSKLAAGC